ncbi:U4/U6.U5 small nuclear ribonucleoprotein [Favolaschia claudopus]|uniref:U4/U6.U5 small nuclear ribonucleoprotein n=1 Tax=Favolaschia claudopus TaxID=2862362 RepID=A0AAW0ANY9_9AGAR
MGATVTGTGTALHAQVAAELVIVTSRDAVRVVRVVLEEVTGIGGFRTVGTTDTMIEKTVTDGGETTAITTRGDPGPEEMKSAIVQGQGALVLHGILTNRCLIEMQLVQKRLNLDPDAPDNSNEEGEEVDMEDDEASMMAMMGMSGFGTTKGRHIEGNQEGAASVKKQRTWRQYMNRRGGFNRPLDKIK